MRTVGIDNVQFTAVGDISQAIRRRRPGKDGYIKPVSQRARITPIGPHQPNPRAGLPKSQPLARGRPARPLIAAICRELPRLPIRQGAHPDISALDVGQLPQVARSRGGGSLFLRDRGDTCSPRSKGRHHGRGRRIDRQAAAGNRK